MLRYPLALTLSLLCGLASTAGAQTLGSLTYDPPHLSPGTETTGTVTLTAPAPAGGVKVKLTSNNANFPVPATVHIGAGKTSASFRVTAGGGVGNFWGLTTADWNRVVKTRVRVSDSYDPWAESESISTTGTQGNADSGEIDAENDGDSRRMSGDGRYLVFSSTATNLIANDHNRRRDVFLRDRVLGTTIRVSQNADGSEFNSDSSNPNISANGAFVVFEHRTAGNVMGIDVWESTTRSITTIGATANDDSFSPSISSDGRFIAFASYASNLVANDTNGCCDILLWRRSDSSITRSSVNTASKQGDGDSFYPSISADGSQIAFESDATNFGFDRNGYRDVFVRDRSTNTTARISVADDGSEFDAPSSSPSISGDGTLVSFLSFAPSGGLNHWGDRMECVRNRALNSTVIAKLGPGELESFDIIRYRMAPTMTNDGKYVVYTEAYYDADYDQYLGSRLKVMDAGTGELINFLTDEATFSGADVNVSRDGRWAVVQSNSPNLAPGDVNGKQDIFLMELIPNSVRSVTFEGSFRLRQGVIAEVGAGRPATVGLLHAAPPGGTVVNLYDTYGRFPASVVIPEGQTSVTLSVDMPTPGSYDESVVASARSRTKTTVTHFNSIGANIQSVTFDGGQAIIHGQVIVTTAHSSDLGFVLTLYRDGVAVFASAVTAYAGQTTSDFAVLADLEPGSYASELQYGFPFQYFPGNWFIVDR